MSLGDLISQKAIERNPYDIKRSLRSAVLGFAAIGLNLYGWYYKVLPFLFSRVFPQVMASSPALSTVIVDQAVFAPLPDSGGPRLVLPAGSRLISSVTSRSLAATS